MAAAGPTLQKVLDPVVGRFLSGEYEVHELAAKLRLIIEDQSQHLPSQIAFSSLMSKFMVSGLDLLNYNDPKELIKYKIAGLTIFDCLLDVNDEIMPERRIEIANHIGKVLENDKVPLVINEIVLRTASLSIGHFARVASTTEVEFLQNFYYPLALKLIGDSRSDPHRYGGAIILTQLAHFSPALIFSKRKVLFNVIWDAVCDRNKTVRTAAAATLEASLQVISQREAMSDYIRSALKQIDMGFSSATAEKILGGLIILDTLMSGAVVTFAELNNTMRQQGVPVQEIAWKVIQRKDWRDPEVRLKIIELIPNMAGAFSNAFQQPNAYTSPHSFLTYALRHYMDCIIARKEREQCYHALSKIFVSVAPYFKATPNIVDIFNVIVSGLKDPFCIHALPCLGTLINVSSFSRRFIENKVIDLMFRGGLTTELIDALKVVIKHIPAIRTYSQSKLKQAAAAILSKHSVSIEEKRVRAQPSTAVTPKEPSTRSWFSSSRASVSLPEQALLDLTSVSSVEKLEEEIVFALEVLAMPEFFPKLRERMISPMARAASNSQLVAHPNHTITTTATAMIVPLASASTSAEEQEALDLLVIVRNSVVRYMDDFSPKIRQAAMHACATVLNIVLPLIDLNSTSFYLPHQLLDRLLVMGVGDDSSIIRHQVFASITPVMDKLVSLTDNVHCLVEALHDESISVRAAAMTVLGRIAHFDALHVLPTLRLALKRLIFTLNTTQESRMKLESAQMLQAFVRGMESFIIPYVKQILAPLMVLLSDKVTDIVVVALSTIGDLALCSHESVREHLDELAPRLIDVLNDESSLVKQETAVVALGKFVSSLATVTQEPYKRYDGLFEGLVKAAQNVDENSTELRLQAIKTLGLLGAVDVFVYQRHLMKSSAGLGAFSSSHLPLEAMRDREEYVEQPDDEDPTDVSDRNSDEYPVEAKDEDLQVVQVERHYFSVVIRGLMTILRDNGLTFYHQNAMATAIRIIRIMGPKAANELNEVLSAILFRLFTDSGNNIKDSLLDHLISLIHIMGTSMVRHAKVVVKIIHEFSQTHLQLCLDLVESMGSAFPTPDFNRVMRDVVPLLLRIIEDEACINMPGVGMHGADAMVGDDIDGEGAALVSGAGPGYLMPSSGSSVSKQPLMASNSDRNRRSSKSVSGASGLKTSKILQKFVNMSDLLGEYRRDFIPFLITLLDSPVLVAEVKKEGICTLMHLSNESDLPEFAGRIVHALLRQIASVSASLSSNSVVAALFNSSGMSGLVQLPEMGLLNTILNAFSCLVCRLGTYYLPYVISVRRKIRAIPYFGKQELLVSALSAGAGSNNSAGATNVTKWYRLEEYEVLVNRLLKQRPLPPDPADTADVACKVDERVRNRATTSRYLRDSTMQINMTTLETAWALAGRNNASDLIQWMGRLTIELIRQSPSPILRSCATLAKTYRPLAEELFNTSFHSIWDELFASQLNEVVLDIPLINGIETALDSAQIPKNIMVALLNLAEFMDMQDKRLPIDVELLAKRSQDANMFAKCLRFREIQFGSKNVTPSFECIDAMVTINNQLGLPDRAIGILRHLKLKYPQIEIQPRWLEKLLRWEDAHMAYESDIATCKQSLQDSGANPFKHERWLTSELGRLRCLQALGEMDELVVRAENLKAWMQRFKEEREKQGTHTSLSTNNTEEESLISPVIVQEIQKMGAHASWRLGHWDKMEDFLDYNGSASESLAHHVDPKDVVLEHNIVFYHTLVAIHQHDYHKALALIGEIRSTLSGAIAALLSESYSRAYRAMVTMQTLAELEEVVEYKSCAAKANFDSEKVRTANAAASGHLPLVSEMSDATGLNEPGSEKVAVDLVARKAALLDKWKARLKWAPRDIEVYRQILSVHSLVAEPEEDLDSWIELVTLCRKEGMYGLCANLLRRLGAPLQPKRIDSDANLVDLGMPGTPTSPTSPVNKTNDRIKLATYEYWWSNGEKDKALCSLTGFLQSCSLPETIGSSKIGGVAAGPVGAGGALSAGSGHQEAVMFRVRCLLKRAQWMQVMDEDNVHGVLDTLLEARDLAKDQYSVWHAWAVANYDQLKKVSTDDKPLPTIAETTEAASPVRDKVIPAPSPPRGHHANKGNMTVKLHSTSGTATLLNLVSVQQADKVTTYVVEGIKGFVRSIVLGQGQPVANLLQDTLRLITLLFSYGSKKGVSQILDIELEKVSPDNWLTVVPQLIARIHVKSPEISGLLRKLLCKVAATHPQALVCPISVALNTSDNRQRAVATDVLLEVRKNNKQLVEEATMVSRELMRVAITPHELWFDGLEQAAQLYMDAKDVSAMLGVLKDLHETMQDGAGGSAAAGTGTGPAGFSEGLGNIGFSTLRDLAFRQNYGKALQDAWFWVEQFRSSGRTIDLHQAWEIYQNIFKKIKVQIAALKRLELHHVSPALTAAKNLILAIPGTYRPASAVISITAFSPAIHVITSKQRPRKMCLWGSDGKKYPFLLKGHEDLRQDERVMQLFGLINVCLQNDRITSRHALNIVRYSVLPLSNNSGLIGWVENCDTINQLVKQYREAKDIRLLIELKLLQSKCNNFDKLPVLHKAELFRQVLDETSGDDLMRMIWLKSKSSDVWIERRAHFTKSLAVMSIVGYVLGLGDRHPSNLMLDRISGNVVHIDFGDCFEITKHRAKYPEIVPFRLTRMLTNCMGVAGIEGTYRLTSERVMRVMRDNRYSVMAMLEAFVYDPLISWRLLAKHTVQGAQPDQAISRVSSSDDSKSPMDKINHVLQGGASFRDVLPGLGNGSMDAVEAGVERSPRRTSAGASSMMRGHDLTRALSQDGMALGEDEPFQENLNTRALEVINRIQAKLTGRDFAKSDDAEDLNVADQVDRLIKEATSIENLCQLFNGWCPLW